MKKGMMFTLAVLFVVGLFTRSWFDARSSTIMPEFTDSKSITTDPDPIDLVSKDSLLSFLTELTNIHAYVGWRSPATEGEKEGLDYMSNKLDTFSYLKGLGIEKERQAFQVDTSTQFWTTTLSVTINGNEVKIPTNGIPAPQDSLESAKQFDSDGKLNDTKPNPVIISRPVVVIRTEDDLDKLKTKDINGNIVFLNYAVIFCKDRECKDHIYSVGEDLLNKKPAGIVMVSKNSDNPDEDHGTFIADDSIFTFLRHHSGIPIFYSRMEDMDAAGIKQWDDLATIEKGKMVWDADVISPATSGNLVVKIPGKDSARAVMLGAHIDSTNDPGALDDGSGSVALLEIARVIDEAKLQPPVDLYLSWWGSEELGLKGSEYYANTHQDVLKHLIAMLEVDCLTKPISTISNPQVTLVNMSYNFFGIKGLSWVDVFSKAAAKKGIETIVKDQTGVSSDNWSFGGYNVPNVHMIYGDEEDMGSKGGVHFAGYLHSSYDTVDIAKEVSDVLVNMTKVALVAALDVPQDITDMRVTPPVTHRALFIGSHTENPDFSPAGMPEIGMTLASQGYEVDFIPYGNKLTGDDLKNTNIVFIPPVYRFSLETNSADQISKTWSKEEIDLIKDYVAQGGLLVLTNSAVDDNVDKTGINDLGSLFGISYQKKENNQIVAEVVNDHPLVKGMKYLLFDAYSGVPFKAVKGQVIAQTADGTPAVAVVDYEKNGGKVIALLDLSGLWDAGGNLTNLPFWQNLATYGINR